LTKLIGPGDQAAILFFATALQWAQWAEQNRDGWFYKTADEWTRDFGITRNQLPRIIQKVAPFGLECKLKRVNGAPALHFRIDWDLLNEKLTEVSDLLESRKSGIQQNVLLESSKTSNNNTYKNTFDPDGSNTEALKIRGTVGPEPQMTVTEKETRRQIYNMIAMAYYQIDPQAEKEKFKPFGASVNRLYKLFTTHHAFTAPEFSKFLCTLPPGFADWLKSPANIGETVGKWKEAQVSQTQKASVKEQVIKARNPLTGEIMLVRNGEVIQPEEA
jgi:hypothetical protein